MESKNPIDIKGKVKSARKKKSPKDIMVIVVMLVCVVYLLNPTFGFIEFLPDKLPIVGNIDEGVATALLLSGLKYFGYNFTDLFKKRKDNNA